MNRLTILMGTTLLGFAASLLQAQEPRGNPGQNLLDPSLNEPLAPDSKPPPEPDTPPDATVTLSGGSAAAGIGFVWGNGKVSYQGTDHAFTIHGVSALDVGGSQITASGIVMHLSKLEDFKGKYSAFGAGVTFVDGRTAVYLKNEHGVVVKLISKTKGLRFNLAASGISVNLKS